MAAKGYWSSVLSGLAGCHPSLNPQPGNLWRQPNMPAKGYWLLVLLGLASCAKLPSPAKPEHSSLQPLTNSPVINAAGLAAAQAQWSRDLAGGLIGYYGLVADADQQQYLNRIGLWLGQNSAKPHHSWRFGILNSRRSFAIALPEGQILVSVSLLRKMRSEAELAALLSLEIARVLHQQPWSGLPPGLDAQTFDSALTLYAQPLPAAAQFAIDQTAIWLLAKAGYNPYAVFGLLLHLGQSAEFHATSAASTAARLEALAELDARLKPYATGVEQSSEFEQLWLKAKPEALPKAEPVSKPELPPIPSTPGIQAEPSSSPLPANTIIHPQRIQM